MNGVSLGGGSGGGIKCMTVRHPTSPTNTLGVGRYVRDTPEPAELLRLHREKAQATKYRLAVSAAAAEGAAQVPAEGEDSESLQVGVQYLPPGATYIDSVVIDVDGGKDDAFSLASVTATAGEAAEQTDNCNNPLSEISMELSEQTQSAPRPVPRRSRSRRQPVMFEPQNQS